MQKKKYNNFLEEIANLQNSYDFDYWMNMILKSDIDFMNSRIFVEGYCEDLAVYFVTKYEDVELIFCNMDGDISNVTDGHAFLKYKNKFYDGVNINGVTNVEEMAWFKSNPILKQKDITKGYIHNFYKKHIDSLLRYLKTNRFNENKIIGRLLKS